MRTPGTLRVAEARTQAPLIYGVISPDDGEKDNTSVDVASPPAERQVRHERLSRHVSLGRQIDMRQEMRARDSARVREARGHTFDYASKALSCSNDK